MIGVYIDIDAIVDSRLSVFMDISPKLASFIYADGYIERISDSFSVMCEEEFKDRYSARTKKTISTPLPTKITSLLEVHTMTLSQDSVMRGGSGDVVVYLNTYPYDLTTHEMQTMEYGLRSKMPPKVRVEIIDTRDVSTEFMLNNITTMIKYDGLRWVEGLVRDKKITIGTISSIELIVPDNVGGAHDTTNTDRYAMLSELNIALLPYIDITFIPVGFFSFHLR